MKVIYWRSSWAFEVLTLYDLHDFHRMLTEDYQRIHKGTSNNNNSK